MSDERVPGAGERTPAGVGGESVSGGDRLTLRQHLERFLPTGSRARRIADAGVVAWAVVGVAAVVWLLFHAFHRLAGVVPYLVVAGLTVMLLGPAVRGLVRLRMPREVGATAVFLVAAAATPALAALLVKTLVAQVRSLLESQPAGLRKGGFVGRLIASHNSLLHRVGTFVQSWVTSHQHNAGKTLTTLSLVLAHAGVVVLIGGLLGYLVMLSRPNLSSGFMLLVPPGRRPTVDEVLHEMGLIVAGYVRARLIVSLVVGVLTTIGLWAIGMPFWLVLGIVVGIANLVPALGSFIGGAPVVLVALLTKPPVYVFAAVAVMIVAHAVDGYILSPIVLRGAVRLHPVVVLLAVVVGADLLGLYGILAAIPITGMAAYLIRRFVMPKLRGDPDEPEAIPAADLPLAERPPP